MNIELLKNEIIKSENTMKNSLFQTCIVIFCALAVCNCNQLYKEEGESCAQDDSKVCTLLDNCHSAKMAIKDGKMPKICKFKGIEPIVCCDNNQNVIKPPHKKFCERYTTVRNRLLPPGFINSELINNYGRERDRSKRQIYNGDEASSGEFPYMAHIGYKNNTGIAYLCGGSLISAKFVLTAGHCLYHQVLGDPKYARLGDLDVSRDDDDTMPQNFFITQTFLHPNYSTSLYNDIGLLRLDRNVIMTKFVIPACLYSELEVNTTRALAAGWGNVGHLENPSNHLLKVELGWYTTADCNESFKNVPSTRQLNRGILSDRQICAGGVNEIRDACMGDSGGPLQIFDENKMFTIVGVTSSGMPCGFTNAPGVYTRVSAYIEWIERIVWNTNALNDSEL